MNFKNLADHIATDPKRIFWSFVLLHLLVWTIVPSLVSQNLPLDVIEGYAWGNEWVIGTYKHPPMQAWILEILYTITGRARWAPYLASQVAIVTAFWAVWQMGVRIVGAKAALVGVMLLEGVVYYNFTSPEFNPNVLQIPFWALTGLYFFKGIKDDKPVDWALLGVWSAAGMYTKYSSGLFLLALFATMVCHRDGRHRFKSVGPYLAVVIAAVLFYPHLRWLIQNDFLPLQYVEGRLQIEHHQKQYSVFVTTFMMVAGQVLALLGVVLLAISLYDQQTLRQVKPVPSFDRMFLSFVAFGPFVVMFIASLVFGYHIRDMWETPFWNFIGLWTVAFFRPVLAPDDLRRFLMSWSVVSIGLLLLFISNETLSPYVASKPKRTNFPGKELSAVVIDTWHLRFHTPIKYVVGDVWPAGNIAWYADDRPHVFLQGNRLISPWIDPTDLAHSGAVLVWSIADTERSEPNKAQDSLQQEFPTAELQPPLTLKRMTFADVPAAKIGWAIVPPTQ